MNTYKTNLLFNKLIVKYLLLLLMFLSMSMICACNDDNNDFQNEFKLHSQMIESVATITDIMTPYENKPDIADSLTKIEYINVRKLQTLIDNEKPTLIYFWSTYKENEPDVYLWKEIVDANTYNFILISTDVSTKAQIKVLNKFLYYNDFFHKSYIIYRNFNTLPGVISEVKSLDKAKSFVNNIINKTEIDSIHFPYTVILQNNKIKYAKKEYISKSVLNIEFLEKMKSKCFDCDIAFKNFEYEEIDNASEKESIVFPSQVTINYLDDTTLIPEKYKLKAISPAKMRSFLKSGNKKLIHIWGSWCPTTSLGINDIKKLIPKPDDTYQTMLISADMHTNGQIDLIEKFLYNNQIYADSYIIENKFENMNDLDEFIKYKHVIDFINSFDNEYSKIALPYTVVLDEGNNIIYKKALEIDENALQIDNQTVEEKYFNDFKNMEVEKIKQLLSK